MNRIATALLLAALPVTAAAFTWNDTAPRAAEAARLFDQACLATLPGFAAAGTVLDRAGFVRYEATNNRLHRGRSMSAMVLIPDDTRPNGTLPACAVLAEDVPAAALAAALAPAVAARLGPATRREQSAPGQIIWSAVGGGVETRVTAAQHAADSYVGVTIVPVPAPAEAE